VPDAPLTPQQLAAAIDKNYAEYVATAPIYVGGALAYAVGHPVSSASVQDGTVDPALVAKVGTKAAESAAPPAAPVAPTA
jgi:hypothetical protein